MIPRGQFPKASFLQQLPMCSEAQSRHKYHQGEQQLYRHEDVHADRLGFDDY